MRSEFFMFQPTRGFLSYIKWGWRFYPAFLRIIWSKLSEQWPTKRLASWVIEQHYTREHFVLREASFQPSSLYNFASWIQSQRKIRKTLFLRFFRPDLCSHGEEKMVKNWPFSLLPTRIEVTFQSVTVMAQRRPLLSLQANQKADRNAIRDENGPKSISYLTVNRSKCLP